MRCTKKYVEGVLQLHIDCGVFPEGTKLRTGMPDRNGQSYSVVLPNHDYVNLGVGGKLAVRQLDAMAWAARNLRKEVRV